MATLEGRQLRGPEVQAENQGGPRKQKSRFTTALLAITIENRRVRIRD